MYSKTIITGLSCLSSITLIAACSGAANKPPTAKVDGVTQTSTILVEAQELVARSAVSDTTAKLAMSPSIEHIHVEPNTEKYQTLELNPIHVAALDPVSTFSIDVDTGSYANVRRFLNAGELPPVDAVRVEEMLNYFSYDYTSTATQEQPFSVTTELGSSPWNNKTALLHVGLKGFEPENLIDRPSNLVFLIDVSGSMSAKNKLGLLKPSIEMLSRQLDGDDHVSIVVYAGASGVVLEPTAGNEHQTIAKAIKKLSAGGSTNGQAGIELAYEMAEKNFTEGGVNRVILATDGDFNVGISDIDQLKKLIEKKRESGIALTTLGFGTGNYNDYLMEQLADVGNGNYAYIDTINEARKVLVDELNSTLLTIASDVKIQIEFNPAIVSEYRLIGYSNRKLANEDFNNDKVDAGEIGAGHTVTALYELALVGSGGERHSESRYDKPELSKVKESLINEIGELRIRYKLPGSDKSQLISEIIDNIELPKANENSNDFNFSASIAAFAQTLTDSKYLESYTLTDAARLAKGAIGEDDFGYRAELLRLINIAESLRGITYSSHRLDKESNG